MQLSTILQNAPPATLLLEVSPTPTLARSCLDPTRTMSSLFTSPKTRFLVALGHHRKDRPYRRLFLLRSIPPSTSPFALARASPNLSGRFSLGFPPL